MNERLVNHFDVIGALLRIFEWGAFDQIKNAVKNTTTLLGNFTSKPNYITNNNGRREFGTFTEIFYKSVANIMQFY